ncbi:hypothetical protein SB6407_05576 [Klebsiella pasteurii]|uniref:hypothetical protein n=1 Tax=Klebsiella pasteurii TaxID=2587529 RepID=UPI00116C2B18|nr:hypothetical protein [Klebsiella pasteurii]VUS45435.1 hypothetical protein SB6407_05576 [Klebsiella pasteurii]
MTEEEYEFLLRIYNRIKDDGFCVHLLKQITFDDKYSGEDFLKEYEKRNGGKL